MITKNQMQQLVQALPLTKAEERQLKEELRQKSDDDPRLQQKFAYFEQWLERARIDNRLIEVLEKWDGFAEKDREKILRVIGRLYRRQDNKKISQLREKLASS